MFDLNSESNVTTIQIMYTKFEMNQIIFVEVMKHSL